MRKLEEKSKLLIFIISEIICFFVVKISIDLFENNDIYSIGINIVQFLYFLAMFVSSLYLLLGKNSNLRKLIYTSFGLILYSLVLHFFIKQIASLFTTINGIIHFVEYASKIYFICLPLIGYKILLIKKEESIQKVIFLLGLRIILFIITIFLFRNLFALKGVLYSWPLSEFITMLLFRIKHRKSTPSWVYFYLTIFIDFTFLIQKIPTSIWLWHTWICGLWCLYHLKIPFSWLKLEIYLFRAFNITSLSYNIFCPSLFY